MAPPEAPALLLCGLREVSVVLAVLGGPPRFATRYSVADYANITAAWDAAVAGSPGGNFEFFVPAGTYAHAGVLALDQMKNVRVYGEGVSSIINGTVFTAAALRFRRCFNVWVENLYVKHDTPVTRLDPPESAGIHNHGSSYVYINSVKVSNTASAGIWSEAYALGARPIYCEYLRYNGVEVRDTLSDGIHNTNGCKNVRVNRCRAYNTGDDSFSAINYTNTIWGTPAWARLIEDYWCDDCYAENNNTGHAQVGASAAIEGAINSGIRRLESHNSPGAAIQIASDAVWSNWPSSDILVSDCLLDDSNVANAGHPCGILVDQAAGDMTRVTIEDNLITTPGVGFATIQLGSTGSFRCIDTVINRNVSDASASCDEFLYAPNDVNTSGADNFFNGSPVGVP